VGGAHLEEEDMDDRVRAFGTELGGKALARDWSGVHAMLAPWMRAEHSVDDVRAFFEDEYRKTLEANEVREMHYPECPDAQLDGNDFTKATQLRKPISFAGGKVRPVAPEVTDENVRYWLSLQLLCSDAQMDALGFDCFCEAWAAVVDTDEGLRIGYWSQGAY
jgi:hypothetical protein